MEIVQPGQHTGIKRPSTRKKVFPQEFGEFGDCQVLRHICAKVREKSGEKAREPHLNKSCRLDLVSFVGLVPLVVRVPLLVGAPFVGLVPVYSISHQV